MNRSPNDNGFTLVEMLVVLAILVAITAVAVRSTSNVRDAASFDRSIDVLDATETSILGEYRNGVFVPGFLSDIGRLPTPSTDPDRRLIELWELPIGVAPSRLESDVVDGEITLAVGWRGPYLQLPPGADRAQDGFGGSIRYESATTVALTSYGADGVPGGMDYDADRSRVLKDISIGIDRIRAEVSGIVTVKSGPSGVANWTVVVYAYAPNPVDGSLLAIAEDPDAETPNLTEFPVTFHY